MARNRWQESEDFSISQTPLIDIIFILIVFFLVATTFHSEERDLEVELAEGSEGTLIQEGVDTFVINVRRSGVIVVSSEVLDMGQLEELVIKWVAADDKPRVEIRGDAGTIYASIMQIIDLCHKHGITDLALTQRVIRETE